MLFMIYTLVLLALATCYAEEPDAEITKKIEEFMTSIKSSSLSTEEKKGKFEEFISSLGGSYKAEYDSLVAEMKSRVNTITDENVRSLGNQLIYMFENGDLLSDDDFSKEKAKTENLAAKLTNDQQEILRSIEMEMMPKFGKAFLTYKPIRGMFDHSSLFGAQTVPAIVPVETNH